MDTHLDTCLAVRNGILKLPETSKLGDLLKPAKNRIAQLGSENAQLQTKVEDFQKIITSNKMEIDALKGLPNMYGHHSEGRLSEDSGLSKSSQKESGETETPDQPEADFQKVPITFSMHDFYEILPMAEENFARYDLPEMNEDMDMVDASTIDEGKSARKRRRHLSPASVTKDEDDHTPLDNDTLTIADSASENTIIADARVPGTKPRTVDSTMTYLRPRVSEVLGSHTPLMGDDKESKLESSDSGHLMTNDDAQDFASYEHRPKTWPFRQAFRRSVDFSVRSLLRGLEKLKV